VVEHVGGLLGHALVGLAGRGPGDLLRLLLDLRADAGRFREQLGRVAGGRISGAPVVDRALQRRQRLGGLEVHVAPVEATALTRVAGGAGRLDQRQQRVLVAVVAQRLEAHDVAGGLPLVPQLLTRARPEPDLAGLARAPLRLLVHVGEREHLAGAGVLDYAGL
jgi:hypothetical protein